MNDPLGTEGTGAAYVARPTQDSLTRANSVTAARTLFEAVVMLNALPFNREAFFISFL